MIYFITYIHVYVFVLWNVQMYLLYDVKLVLHIVALNNIVQRFPTTTIIFDLVRQYNIETNLIYAPPQVKTDNDNLHGRQWNNALFRLHCFGVPTIVTGIVQLHIYSRVSLMLSFLLVLRCFVHSSVLENQSSNVLKMESCQTVHFWWIKSVSLVHALKGWLSFLRKRNCLLNCEC